MDQQSTPCRNCGKPMPVGSSFCFACGSSNTQAAPSSTPPTSSFGGAPNAPAQPGTPSAPAAPAQGGPAATGSSPMQNTPGSQPFSQAQGTPGGFTPGQPSAGAANAYAPAQPAARATGGMGGYAPGQPSGAPSNTYTPGQPVGASLPGNTPGQSSAPANAYVPAQPGGVSGQGMPGGNATSQPATGGIGGYAPGQPPAPVSNPYAPGQPSAGAPGGYTPGQATGYGAPAAQQPSAPGGYGAGGYGTGGPGSPGGSGGYVPPSTPPPQKKKVNKVALILIIVAVLAVVGVLAYLGFSASQKKAAQAAEHLVLLESITSSYTPAGVASYEDDLLAFYEDNPEVEPNVDLVELMDVCVAYEDAVDDDVRYTDMLASLESLISGATSTSVVSCAEELHDTVQDDYEFYLSMQAPPPEELDIPDDFGDDDDGLDDDDGDEGGLLEDQPMELLLHSVNNGNLGVYALNRSGKTITYFEMWVFCYDENFDPAINPGSEVENALIIPVSGVTVAPNGTFDTDYDTFEANLDVSAYAGVKLCGVYFGYCEFDDGTSTGMSERNGQGELATARLRMLKIFLDIAIKYEEEAVAVLPKPVEMPGPALYTVRGKARRYFAA